MGLWGFRYEGFGVLGLCESGSENPKIAQPQHLKTPKAPNTIGLVTVEESKRKQHQESLSALKRVRV
jgi:hypothetical protein